MLLGASTVRCWCFEPIAGCRDAESAPETRRGTQHSSITGANERERQIVLHDVCWSRTKVFYAEKHKYTWTRERRIIPVSFGSLASVRELKEWSEQSSPGRQHLSLPSALFFLQTHTRGLPSGRLHNHKLRPSAAHDCTEYWPSTEVSRVCVCVRQRKITLQNTHLFFSAMFLY